MSEANPIIMVSSSVTQIEDILDQIFGMLRGYGYTVWMSCKNTLPHDSSKSNLDNCLDAVQNCDLFFGLITPYYGRDRIVVDYSYTHLEQRKAIEINKKRWFLAHDRVIFAQKILEQYRFFKNGKPRKNFRFKKTEAMDDVRVINMYEEAARLDLPPDQRTGNWVDEYINGQGIRDYVNEIFADINSIRHQVFVQPGVRS